MPALIIAVLAGGVGGALLSGMFAGDGVGTAIKWLVIGGAAFFVAKRTGLLKGM